MFKTTLLRVVNPLTFVLFILFFNTTNAQSVDKITKPEEKTSRFLKSPIFLTDRVNSVVSKEKDVLMEDKIFDSNGEKEKVFIAIVDEKVLNTNFDTVTFVKYYKQFVVFYKNIS